MIAERYPYMSVQQYLDMDRSAGVKHEYVDGVAYAMAGGSKAHNQLGAVVIFLLNQCLRGSECRVYSSDMRVKVDETHFFYADATVGCDTRDLGPGDILLYPRVIVEVSSPSTETYDRGDKFEAYGSRDSLQDYVLISQRSALVEVRSRSRNGWTHQTYGADAVVGIPSIDVQFAVAELYAGVQLADIS